MVQHIDAAQAEGLQHNALVAHGDQRVKDFRLQTGGQLQQEDFLAHFLLQLGRAAAAGKYPLIHHKALRTDNAGVSGVDGLKGGEAGCPDFYSPAAKHHLPVESDVHARMPGGSHGEGGAQIIRPVGENVLQRQLGTGEYHRYIDVRQHEGDGRGGVGHGVGAMGHDDAVEIAPPGKNVTCDLLPFFGADVGGVQTHDFLHGDVVVGLQLQDLPLHHRVMGLQTLRAGPASDGAAGGQKQNILFCLTQFHTRAAFSLRKICGTYLFIIYYTVMIPK